jgi:hypothetical protein
MVNERGLVRTPSASQPLIRPASISEAARLSELVMRSKAYWGYSPEFLEQAAPELTVSEQEIADGKVSVAELHERPVGVSVLDLADRRSWSRCSSSPT